MTDAAVSSAEILEVLSLTLQVSGASTLLGAALGVPIGLALGTRPRVARAYVRALLYTFYGLPPIVAGLLVYLLLSRNGPLGPWGLLFRPPAIVLAETLLAAPLIAGLTVTALGDISRPVREAIHSAAAPAWLRDWAYLREARRGVLAAVMVGFGRSISEVAAALVVGGNIRHQTRTLSTAIFQTVNQGDFDAALRLAGLLLLLALGTFLVLSRLQGRDVEEDA